MNDCGYACESGRSDIIGYKKKIDAYSSQNRTHAHHGVIQNCFVFNSNPPLPYLAKIKELK